MPDSHSHSAGPSLTAIERARCPKCTSRMSLARIAPGPKGFDIRTFECGKCDYVHIISVEKDPMKSRLSGWLDGDDLRPPK
jgi:hypothetical protein